MSTNSAIPLPGLSLARPHFRLKGILADRARLRAYALPLLLFFAGTLYYLLGINQPLNIHDEGHAVYGASRILRGEVPYRDFELFYPPAQSYLFAGLFKIFGTSIVIERLWDVLTRAALSVLVYLMILRLTQRRALLSWAIVVMGLVPIGFYFGYAGFSGVLLSLVCILTLLHYFSRGDHRLLFLAGLVLGLTALWKHEMAFFTLVPSSFTLAAFEIVDSRRRRSKVVERFFQVVRAQFIFAAGIIIPIAPVIAYLYSVAALRDAWLYLVVMPFRGTLLNHIRVLSLPGLIPQSLPDAARWLDYYFLLAVSLMTVVLLGVRFRRLGQLRDSRVLVWGTLLLMGSGVMYYTQALGRADGMHLMPAFIFACILLGVIWSTLVSNLGGGRLFKSICIVLFVGAIFYYVMPSTLQMILNVSHLSSLCTTQVPRAGCVSVGGGETQALDYISAHSSSDKSIFVGNARHDQIFVSDVMFYFLADRRSASKQYDLIPGWATTSAVQQDIIEDLQKARARYIVLFSGTESVGEGVNQSTTDNGATALDEFIRQNSDKVEQFDEYSVWKLRDASDPE